MGLGKQAKTLSRGQIDAMLAYLSTTRHPTRNRLIFLLSVKVGLRAKEIAKLTWWMVNDSQGQVARTIYLQDSASKGKSGRVIPMSDEVRNALIEYRNEVTSFAGPNVISTRAVRGPPRANRARLVDVPAGDREHVPAMVPAARVRRLLQSQREENLHHKCSQEDLDGRWVAEGRSRARWARQPPHDAEVHRGKSGSAGPRCGLGVGELPGPPFKGRKHHGPSKKLQTRIFPNHSCHLRILLDPRPDGTASPPTPNERRWRTNGYSDQPLVTNGAGAATGYLPTGLLPTGYLPTGYLPTGAGAAATG
jgi:hypothetical protein